VAALTALSRTAARVRQPAVARLGALFLAASVPVLLLHVDYQPHVSLDLGGTDASFKLSDLAVLALAAGYATSLGIEGEALDARAPVLAASLFLLAELAYWSLELREGVAEEPGAYGRRIGLLSALALGALALGAGLLAVVDAGERSGLAFEALGAVAAVAALALVALTTRRPEP